MLGTLNKRKALFVLAAVIALALVVSGCGAGNNAGDTEPKEKPRLILATTTSTYDSGLLDVLVPAFEEKYGYEVHILSKGTGASLELGKRGDAHVMLVHAKDTELQLVEEGYFVDRHDVMYNDFIVLGPSADPAGIKGLTEAVEAFKKIAAAEQPFVSRGDESGTHIKEKSIWAEAGIEPAGSWYSSVGQGMGDTLNVANQMGAYTFADRGTYIAMKNNLNLEIVLEGDPVLFNQYGVMATNPDKHPNTNYEGAKAFIEFMISSEGQGMIGDFKQHGESLFTPNAA
ncbi:MAG: substrate-binding domain-containing protein [Bacillota bacterium]